MYVSTLIALNLYKLTNLIILFPIVDVICSDDRSYQYSGGTPIACGIGNFCWAEIALKLLFYNAVLTNFWCSEIVIAH